MMMMKKKKNQISSSSSSLSRDDHDHKKNKKRKVIGTTPNGEADVTEDLILEIFTHLPPTSLLRFKSISKSLHSLISNPDILRRNAVHQFRRQDPSPPPPPGILLKRQDLSGDSKILIFPPPPSLHGDGDDHQHYGYSSTQLLQNVIDYRPEHDQPEGEKKVKFTVIDSCNGLLLYLNCVRHQNPPGGKCIWYVCNPITKDYIKLPPLEEEQGLKILEHSSASLVFDPSLSLTYKVVIWLKCGYNYLPEHYRLYVYSSETRSWRLSVSTNGNDFPYPVLQYQFSFEFRAVLLNGVLYWYSLVVQLDVTLCYDVEKDLVWTLKFPNMSVEYYAFRALFYFGVCGGGLRLIEKYYKQHGNIDKMTFAFPSSFDVMEMNQLHLKLKQQHQDQDSNIVRELWTVKYRVNIGEEGYYANLIREKSLFGVFILDLYKTKTKAGGEVEEVLLCIDEHLVISFNLSDNTFGKELRNGSRLTDRFFGYTDVLRYAITLFPLHSLDTLRYYFVSSTFIRLDNCV